MRILLVFVIITVSLILCAYLDITGKVKAPSFYYLLAYLTGFIAGALTFTGDSK